MQEISDDLKNKIAQFQTLQQQLQLVAAQKQQLLVDKSESQAAQEELKAGGGDVYKAVGPLLLKSDRAVLGRELKERVSSTDDRISLLENQEKKLTKRAQELQKDLQSGLQGIQA